MHIFLDDIRMPGLHPITGRPVTWVVCRSAEPALTHLATGTVTFVSFDHDLGDGQGDATLTGYSVARWIEEESATNPKFVPPEFFIHSSNPVGRRNILEAMQAAHRFYQQRIASQPNI